MNGLSIIIASYGVSSYLDECVRSILKQKVDYDVEILIGIDGCVDTLEHVRNNRELYMNTKIFFFEENSGPFVVKNNIICESMYDHILFFDSDDLINDNCLAGLKMESDPDMIMLRFKDFNDLNGTSSKMVKNAHGVFFIKKSIFLELNGFQSWRCGADTEFLKRSYWKGIRYLKINEPFFMRRIHDKNLTVVKDTGFGSAIRKYSFSEIEKRSLANDWPNPEKVVKYYYQVYL